MRVVHVITRFINGGADENTLLTCNDQASRGHDVWLVHGAEYRRRMLGKLNPKVERVELSALVRPISPLRDLAALVQMASLLRRLKPDVVHTHTSKAGIVGRLASLTAPSARVVHGVHILPFLSAPAVVRLLYIVFEKLAARRTHTFIDVSAQMRELCLENGIGAPQQHHVVPSGMDIDGFRTAKPALDLAALRQRWGKDAVVVGYLAVFEPRKRHRELVESVAPALKARPNTHLVFAGDGAERPAVQALVASLGLDAQVHFLGFRDDPQQFVAACDFCVFASLREGLPRAVVQYVAAGKPILSMRLPGIEVVLRDGDNGYLLEGDDFDGLARRFAELAADPSKRAAMSQVSADCDLSSWSAANMLQQIEDIYLESPAGEAGSRRFPRLPQCT